MYQIVIADDERVERSGIRFLLKQIGEEFSIEEFGNGKAAYEWFLYHSADILLTDIKMPFMDGMELISRVSSMYPSMKIVIFSGYSDFEYARSAMRYHVEDYILKPVDPQEFRQTMSHILKDLEKQYRTVLVNGNPRVEAVKQYIHQNYGADLGIELLAKQVCMAPAYLSALFKKETGQNLSKYIRSVRMEKAKELLETTYQKIVDISNEVGYPNVSYFCQSFREYFGVSPQKFRSKGEPYDEALEEN